jgi:hypothetical protein
VSAYHQSKKKSLGAQWGWGSGAGEDYLRYGCKISRLYVTSAVNSQTTGMSRGEEALFHLTTTYTQTKENSNCVYYVDIMGHSDSGINN